MPRPWDHEEDAVDAPIANLESQPPCEGLDVSWRGLDLDPKAPSGSASGDHRIPGALIAGPGEWHLDRPAQGRVQPVPESAEDLYVTHIANGDPPGNERAHISRPTTA